jgi:phage major head subunit gpT-like protein
MASNVLGFHEQLILADRQFTALFWGALESAQARYQNWINLLSMQLQTPGKKSVDHNWMGAVPPMSLWTGSRKIGKLRTEGFRIENHKYANGLELDGDDLEDDSLGLYAPKIQMMAVEGVRFQWRLLRDLLNSAFTALSYDGVAFCSNSHPNHGNTQDNLTDELLDEAALRGADERLAAMEDEEGNPLDLNATHLIVGTDLKWTAKDILERAVKANGETNVTNGLCELIVMPGLTAKYWFLMDLSLPVKPLILQTKRALRPDRMTNPDSPNVFHEDKHYFGASWKGGAGLALWELVQGSNGSGS